MISRGSVIFGVCRFDRLGDQIDAPADASITVLRMITIACGAVPARRADLSRPDPHSTRVVIAAATSSRSAWPRAGRTGPGAAAASAAGSPNMIVSGKPGRLPPLVSAADLSTSFVPGRSSAEQRRVAGRKDRAVAADHQLLPDSHQYAVALGRGTATTSAHARPRRPRHILITYGSRQRRPRGPR